MKSIGRLDGASSVSILDTSIAGRFEIAGTGLAEANPGINYQTTRSFSMRNSTKVIVVATITVLASACSVMKGNETSGQYVDDATLTTRAKAALVKDSTVSATDFNVDTYKGDVTLTGVTKSASEATRAVEDVKEVPGVKSVKNATRVATADRGDGKPE
jgi:hyperosmotically inducible protein